MALPAHRLTAIALQEDPSESLAALARHATSGAWFNGLTGKSIDAMVAITKRHTMSKGEVRRPLRQGYPAPPESRTDLAHAACVALAKRIPAAVEDPSPFPDPHDADARERLLRASR